LIKEKEFIKAVIAIVLFSQWQLYSGN